MVKFYLTLDQSYGTMDQSYGTLSQSWIKMVQKNGGIGLSVKYFKPVG